MAQNARWIEHYRDEKDAAFLYRALAEVESDEKHRDLLYAPGGSGGSPCGAMDRAVHPT